MADFAGFAAIVAAPVFAFAKVRNLRLFCRRDSKIMVAGP
jgi:hypothetical protein